jgi:hypothetical protein
MRQLVYTLLIAVLGTSCGQDRAATPGPPRGTPAPELQVRGGYWSCSQFKGNPQHAVESCYIELVVDASQILNWDRIGCFGQFFFTQLSADGKVSTTPKSFMASFNGRGQYWSKPIRMFEFVYFPESYGALDPRLDWVQCRLIDAGDDMALQEHPAD